MVFNSKCKGPMTFIYLFKRDNAHQFTFLVYPQNVNASVIKKANFPL